MFNQLKALLIVAFLTIAWITPAQANWVVIKSWEETQPGTTKLSDPTYEYITESRSSQSLDADGNTVEKTYSDRYRVETRTKTITSWVRPYITEERCIRDRCRERTRSLPMRGTSTTETDIQKIHMETTLVSETIISYAGVKKEDSTTSTSPFGENQQYLGTATQMVSDDPEYYRNLTQFRSNNELVKQDKALARGWTGKGSTIGILDSGIDLDHPEFADKIKYTYNFNNAWGNGMEDTTGHGSHVASIAAGNLNGDMIGIAPDADLAVVKITNNWNSSMDMAVKGIKWLKNNTDAVVTNLSSNINYSADYKNSITDQGNGVYTSNHVYYGGSNYYNLEKPATWGTALSGTEMVLTVSAGNQDLSYVQNPATFATATDADGNLVLGGRMLVVGNWNASTNSIEGNKSGHVCKNWSGSNCADTYKTSDFYILAPGMVVLGANNDGTYREFSGTSQAAPAVAGAVAVVHQMWPYMKGDQIAQLLLKTADKTIVGYNVNTHGQGLLDLDRATQPVGDLGISFTGRTGTTVPITGGLSIAGGDATSTLSSISTVDELGRDYTINMSSLTQTYDLIPVYQLDHSAGNSWSSKFVGGAQQYRGIHFNAYQSDSYSLEQPTYDNITLGFDSTMFKTRNPQTGEIMNPSAWTEKFTITRSQYSPFVAFNGVFGQVNGTTSFEYSTLYQPNNWYGQAGVMYSVTDFKQGLVHDVTPITSVYALAGWSNNNFNFYGGIKPMIVDGSISLTTPSSVDSNGTMHYTNHTIGLNNDPIGFVGAQFKTNEIVTPTGETHSLRMNGVVDQNNQYKVGAFYEFTF